MAVKVLILNGGMRLKGNSSLMADEFARGCREAGAEVEEFMIKSMNISNCSGCLRCNIIKRCSIQNDDWPMLAAKISAADVLVFSSPVYFHHVTAPLKKVLDRFRSFIHVRITESGLIHTPWQEWKKKFVLITSMGSPDTIESKPIRDLMEFMCEVLGTENTLTVIEGTRLAVPGQILKTKEELEALYPKMELPVSLAEEDYIKNQKLLERCFGEGVSVISDQ
jgi:multimeric flavodoxin WrbA